MVAYGSRLPDLTGQIWGVLGFVSLIVLLRWQELPHAVELQQGISDNKARVRLEWLLSSSDHYLEKLPPCDFPWWMAQWGGRSEGACLNKLGGASYREDLVLLTLLLTSRGVGGEGVGRSAPDASDARALRDGGVHACLCTSDAAMSTGGVPQRRQASAAVIHGHWGPSALGRKVCPSDFFLLCWRILDPGLGYHAGVAPSGSD